MWQEVSLSVPFEYVEPISYLFDRYGYGLSMEDDGPDKIKLRTYLPGDARQRYSHIEVGVRLASILEPLGELQVTSLDNDEDWQNAWKEHFTLLRIGERLVIKPSWIDYEPEESDILVSLTRAWRSAPATTLPRIPVWRPWKRLSNRAPWPWTLAVVPAFLPLRQ